MTARVVFVCILLRHLLSLPEGQIYKPFEIVFENPLENFPLQNMEVDLEAKNIYVSGKNILYRLSLQKDMSIITRQTGPEVNCMKLEYGEYCGDDYNTVVVVTPDSLITCGTLRGGLCLRRDKESLNITKTTKTSSNIRLVSNNQASAVGIFLSISDRSSSRKLENIVLFAKQYTTLPVSPDQLDGAAIFSVLPDLSALNIGSSKFGEIFDMTLRTPVSVVMDFRVVIENENFVFILVNQNSQSRLIKICKFIESDKPKKVYEDIPISCNSEGMNLTHVKHGTFISVSGMRYLVGLFLSSKPTMSAVCVFKENEIYQAFLKSRKNRYGCPKQNLPSKDVVFDEDNGLQNCILYQNFNETFEPVEGLYEAFYKGDFCNKVTNKIPAFGIIVGLLPLRGDAVYSTKSHRVTVIGSSTINNLTTLYIGTDNGWVIQLFYDTEKNKTILLPEFKLDSSEIRAVKRANEETYIMSQNKVLAFVFPNLSFSTMNYIDKIVKLLSTRNCGQYSGNCQQCMDVQDVDCGWCVTKGGCSTYLECANLSSTYWLPSMKNECLSLDLSIDLSRHAYKTEGNILSMMTPLNYLENLTCNLDGLNIPLPIKTERIYCRISSKISKNVLKTEEASLTSPFWGFILIAVVAFVLFLCASFICYKWGVIQGQKLNQMDQHVNETTYNQLQNPDISVENHFYDIPRTCTPLGQTSMADEQERTVYNIIL